MIAALKPYEEYKETGLSWAPIIPKHWEIRPAFGAFAPNYDRNDGMKVKTVLSLSYGRIIIKPADKLRGLVPESFETYQIVNPGYIVLRTTDLQNDHNSLRVGIVKDRGIITSAYLALRTSAGVTPEYGFQFLNVWDSTKAIYGYGSGLRQNLDFSHFKRMPVSVPPPEEQEAIVRFLDHAHGRIDRAIRAKRKVIALLNEQKQAIIHKAVTRGLNPDAPLKPSGISWLGDIPAHWEIRPAFGAFAPNHERNEGMKEKTVLSLSYGRIIIKPAEKLRGLVPESFETYQIVNPGYIILRTTDLQNDHNSLRVGIVKDRGIITSAYLALRTSAGVAPEYGFQFLNVWDSSKAIYGYGSGLRQNLEFSHFRRMPVAVPPPEEQESIVLFISQQANPIERRIGVLSNEIDLLREYRTCLTADVVTGKLDVREAAKSLPSESPEDRSGSPLDSTDLEPDLKGEEELEEVEG